MNCAEYAEWMAEDRIQPLGTAGLDVVAAIGVASLLAPHCEKGKSIKPSEIFPWLHADEPERDSKSMFDGLMATFAMSGVSVKHG